MTQAATGPDFPHRTAARRGERRFVSPPDEAFGRLQIVWDRLGAAKTLLRWNNSLPPGP